MGIFVEGLCRATSAECAAAGGRTKAVEPVFQGAANKLKAVDLLYGIW